MNLRIITNGTGAVGAISQTEVTADFLTWDDVLHDGPVPATLGLHALSEVRARFIADCGWMAYPEAHQRFQSRDQRLNDSGQYDEVLLWFEHDLYDQLQLLQILDACATLPLPNTRLTLICEKAYVAEENVAALQEAFQNRQEVTMAQIQLAVSGWKAVRSNTPAALVAFLKTDTSALPHLKASLYRFLEEYPALKTGLSRNEQQILTCVVNGITRPGPLFRSVQVMEEAKYLGDWSFFRYLAGLVNGPAPLLQTASGVPFAFPAQTDLTFLSQTLSLTALGRRVLEQKADWLTTHPIDRWLGGTHLDDTTNWRWDPDSHTTIYM